MLKLRKILLCNYLYIIILIISIFLTIIRLNITKEKTIKDSYTGIINKIVYKEKSTLIYIDNVVGTTYKKIDLNLGDKVTIYGENTNNFIKIKKYKILSRNKSIYYFIKRIIISSFNDNSYLYTFILGDKSYLKKDVVRSYQENGISHLFAISGMHISLLVCILNKLWKNFFVY